MQRITTSARFYAIHQRFTLVLYSDCQQSIFTLTVLTFMCYVCALSKVFV